MRTIGNWSFTLGTKVNIERNDVTKANGIGGKVCRAVPNLLFLQQKERRRRVKRREWRFLEMNEQDTSKRASKERNYVRRTLRKAGNKPE